jgi:hypothetical protein
LLVLPLLSRLMPVSPDVVWGMDNGDVVKDGGIIEGSAPKDDVCAGCGENVPVAPCEPERLLLLLAFVPRKPRLDVLPVAFVPRIPRLDVLPFDVLLSSVSDEELVPPLASGCWRMQSA